MTWRKPHDRVAPSRELVIIILRDICARHGVRVDDVLAGRRFKKVMLARREAILAIYNSAPGKYSSSGIGRAMNVDHSTVVYHLNATMRESKNERSRNGHRRNMALAVWMTTAPSEVRT